MEEGDTLEFSFLVTNTGNDATDIYIPGINTIAGENVDVTKVEIDTDNDPTGDAFSDHSLAGTNDDGALVPGINADGTIEVKVTAEVTANSAGQPVSVTLGEQHRMIIV